MYNTYYLAYHSYVTVGHTFTILIIQYSSCHLFSFVCTAAGTITSKTSVLFFWRHSTTTKTMSTTCSATPRPFFFLSNVGNWRCPMTIALWRRLFLAYQSVDLVGILKIFWKDIFKHNNALFPFLVSVHLITLLLSKMCNQPILCLSFPLFLGVPVDHGTSFPK